MSSGPDAPELTTLLRAIEMDGDLATCERIVASNFPAFVDNDVLNTFPIEMLFGILSHEEIRYPSPETTFKFFINLFERDPNAVPLFKEMIPYDALSAPACEAIAQKLESLGRAKDGRMLRRIKTLYDPIADRSAPRQIEILSDKVRATSEMLEQTTSLLRQTSEALRQAAETLSKRKLEVKAKDDLIARLSVHKPGKR
jgi:hypothetical protein